MKLSSSTAASLALAAATGVQAADFSFNQHEPTGKPLVSSFFGVPTNATYDYVVVGAGTAGLAFASRLSGAGLSVAVVEAGGFYEVDNGNLSVVPGYTTFYTGTDPSNYQPLIDWGINTTPQPGSADRILHYARGKTMGGSSARNYFLYHRPTVGSHQQWADEAGDDSYLWENMLPYYKQSVNATPPNSALATNTTFLYDEEAFTPAGGPLQVYFGNAVDPFGTWARQAFQKAGMTALDGISSGNLLGSAYSPLTVDPIAAQRQSSESSFLREALNARRAPIVYPQTLATEIMFNDTTATGIKAMTAGTFGTPSLNFTLTARKEVILAAGVFQSPQLLMVSGIGNCDELAEFDIDCRVALPGVGKNMWDHPVFGVSHAVNVNTASAGQNNASLTAQLIELYLNQAAGPLSIFGAGYYGFEKLPEPYRSRLSNSTRAALDTIPADWPEVEWLPISAYNGYNLNKQTADPRDGRNYATLSAALIHPFSRGNVSLNSAHMWDHPKVNPAWYTAPEDIDLILQMFHRNREIWDIFVELGVAEPEEVFPGPDVQTDEQILQWIGESMACVYHAAATCKMGKASDEMAVVDSDAKVHGTEGLRVVDASALPFLTPGHPQSVIVSPLPYQFLYDDANASIVRSGREDRRPDYQCAIMYIVVAKNRGRRQPPLSIPALPYFYCLFLDTGTAGSCAHFFIHCTIFISTWA